MRAWRRISVAAVLLLNVFFLQTSLAGAQPLFSVSPGEFTVRDAPLMGEPWYISEKIVVWNRDNVPRVVSITVEIPPQEDVRPGYEPIPSENWVNPFPSSVLIEENSYAEVQISLNIPSWENLTGQKWEVWIPVERQPLPDETAVLRPTVRMRIETAEELPGVGSGGINFPIFLALGIVVAIAAIAIGAWMWSRRKVGKRWTLARA